MFMWLVRLLFTFVLPCLRLVNAAEKANWALLTVVHLPLLSFWAIDLFLGSCSTSSDDNPTEQVVLSGTTALDAVLAFTYKSAFVASCAFYTVVYACQHPLRCGRHLFQACIVSNAWLPHSEVAESFLPLEQTTSLLQPFHRFRAAVQLARARMTAERKTCPATERDCILKALKKSSTCFCHAAHVLATSVLLRMCCSDFNIVWDFINTHTVHLCSEGNGRQHHYLLVDKSPAATVTELFVNPSWHRLLPTFPPGLTLAKAQALVPSTLPCSPSFSSPSSATALQTSNTSTNEFIFKDLPTMMAYISSQEAMRQCDNSALPQYHVVPSFPAGTTNRIPAALQLLKCAAPSSSSLLSTPVGRTAKAAVSPMSSPPSSPRIQAHASSSGATTHSVLTLEQPKDDTASSPRSSTSAARTSSPPSASATPTSPPPSTSAASASSPQSTTSATPTLPHSSTSATSASSPQSTSATPTLPCSTTSASSLPSPAVTLAETESVKLLMPSATTLAPIMTVHPGSPIPSSSAPPVAHGLQVAPCMHELYYEGIWRKKPAVPEPVQPAESTFVLPLDIHFEDLAVMVSGYGLTDHRNEEDLQRVLEDMVGAKDSLHARVLRGSQAARGISTLLFWARTGMDLNVVKDLDLFLPMTPADFREQFCGVVRREGVGVGDKGWLAALARAKEDNPNLWDPIEGDPDSIQCDEFCPGCRKEWDDAPANLEAVFMRCHGCKGLGEGHNGDWLICTSCAHRFTHTQQCPGRIIGDVGHKHSCVVRRHGPKPLYLGLAGVS